MTTVEQEYWAFLRMRTTPVTRLERFAIRRLARLSARYDSNIPHTARWATLMCAVWARIGLGLSWDKSQQIRRFLGIH